MRVIGMISGTSFDAIDVAAADLELADDEVRLRPLGALSVPYPEPLRRRVADVLPPSGTTMEEVCRLDTELGHAFADAAARGMAELCTGSADLVVSHGQTVFHWVEGGTARGTLQLGQPAWIAERTGLPVVSDLRSRDIAAGGHGAPLVSLFDVLLLSGRPATGALNLGGIANLTVVGDAPLAYDLGPANALIDAAADHFHGEPYDAEGRRAAAGTVVPGLLEALLDEPYYALPAPKSTGKELYSWDYLARRLDPSLSGDDVIATVTELTAVVTARELAVHGLDEVFVSGGGTGNPTLMARLAELAEGRVRTIDELGVPSDAKEAYAFALMGFLTAHGLPGTVPSCTGAAGARVLGTVAPGASGLPRAAAVATAPRRLVVAG
ncbi:anhydro-N-acetylmuramic acid kinase [Nocardioides sp. GXQ0305]|uniref:anhydro-N-acetylmuramic acid kinase n=1 Tax=Nocardioides sp. GXQ0305 TaxID=3423912 RepID=UPI003D7DD824